MSPSRLPRPHRKPAAVAVVLALAAFAALAWPASFGRALAQGETAAVRPIRVGLAVDRSSVKVGASGPFDLVSSTGGQPLLSLPAGEVEISLVQGVLQVSSVAPEGGQPAVLAVCQAPVRIRAADPGRVRINSGPSYRGELEILINPRGLLTVVNEVPLEAYLYGVVPREMPASWEPEALKAQAVAARSYALYQTPPDASRPEGFDILATVDSQVYGGADGEDPRTNAAVDATAGLVITYNGQVANALFHASSGGHTENSENVFVSAIPYLRGVPDFDQDYTYYNWQVDVPTAELQDKLNQAGYIQGRLYSAAPAGTLGVSGRYSLVRLTGSFGVADIKSTDFRRIFGLRSTLYTISNLAEHWEDATAPLAQSDPTVILGANGVTSRTGAAVVSVLGAGGRLSSQGAAVAVSRQLIPATVRIDGHGYGHGVGMSQAGANGMAKKGYTFQQILQYYYQGVKVEAR